MSKLGQKVLIVGATGGIGRCLAISLYKKGYRCILTGRDEKKIRNLSKITENAPYFICDLQDSENIAGLFVFLRKKRIQLNGLVHCAGLSPLMSVSENDEKLMLQTFRINFFSFITIMQHFQRKEISCDNASVVAMSSVATRISSPRQTIYAASKAALDTAIHCMAKEFLTRRIRVNSIVAGAIDTAMLQELKKQSPGLRQKLNVNYPLGLIPVEQIVHTVEYLLSPRSAYVTGTNMVVDSGFLIQR